MTSAPEYWRTTSAEHEVHRYWVQRVCKLVLTTTAAIAKELLVHLLSAYAQSRREPSCWSLSCHELLSIKRFRRTPTPAEILNSLRGSDCLLTRKNQKLEA
jgi:hypothetical protein